MQKARGALRQMGRQASINQAYAVTAMRDKYWQMENPEQIECCLTKSTVIAILTRPGRKSAIVVCNEGEIMLLSQFNTNSHPRIEWTGMVALVSVEKTIPKLVSAAYDAYSDVMFFTTEAFAGVCYAILKSIEVDSRANRLSMMNPLEPWSGVRTQVDEKPELFQDIAVDSENSLLFVSERRYVTVWSIADLARVRRLEVISMPSASFLPGKLGIFLDEFSSTRALLTISDKQTGHLVQMQLRYQHKMLSIGAATRVIPQCDFIATLKLEKNNIATDLHFDKLGNLFILTQGDSKIQIVPSIRALEGLADRPKNGDDELFMNTSWTNMGGHLIALQIPIGSAISATAVVKTTSGGRMIIVGADITPESIKLRMSQKNHAILGLIGENTNASSSSTVSSRRSSTSSINYK